MKRWSAMPVVKTKISAKQLLIITVTMFFVATIPFQLMNVVYADSFDDQIANIESSIKQYQDQAKKLNSKADSLQKEAKALQAQANVIQKQIDLKQAEHDKLVSQIAQNQQKIIDNQNALGDTIASLYVDSDISPLEMLASSKSISDFVDKQVYRKTIQDNLVNQITTIRTTKMLLEEQKNDVDRVIAEQKQAKTALVTKRNQLEQLIAETKGQEVAYKNLVSSRERQKLAVQRQQQEAIEAAMRAANGGSPANVLPGDPNKGGYPWEAGCWMDAQAWSHGGIYGDGTDEIGYGCRQCVSYAAWRAGKHSGHFPMYWGNANQWPASAIATGHEIGVTPRVNSVGIISAGEYGHAVWVEAVNGDGTIDVSQYNYFNAGGPGWGNYSKMRVSAATYDTYIYF